MLLYNLGLRIAMMSFRMVWTIRPMQKYISLHASKVAKFIMGQKDILRIIKVEMQNESRTVYWFHAASYGEFNVIRPIINQVKTAERCIVLTFFSPSGYETLTENTQYKNVIDHIFYLPLDTKQNVLSFLDTVHPKKTIFTISEYWMNYLHELRKRHIPTFMVSMYVGNDSYLLKWYSRSIRNALKAFHTFMVLDENSKNNLKKLGFTNVIVTGNSLFDNAISTAKEPYHNEIIEQFCNKEDVFIAGSISDKKDLALVAALANANHDIKFIVVPHEISEEGLNEIIYNMEGKTLLYSECTPGRDFSDTQILVIDFMGALSRIYRYGNWAYVGGGFTPYLHSTIEPVVYGLPISFGPKIERKRTPQQIANIGIGCIVKSKKDIRQWFSTIRRQEQLEEIKKKAIQYTEANANVTHKVVQVILA